MPTGRLDEVESLVGTWTLRALLRPQAFRTISYRKNWEDEDVLRAVCFEHLIGRDISESELKKQLSLQLKKFEASPARREGVSFRDVERLAGMIGLSESEKEILIFSILLGDEGALSRATSHIGDLTINRLFEELSVILKLKPPQVQKAFQREEPLCSSGLLQLNRRSSMRISQRLEPLDGLSRALLDPNENIESMLSLYFDKAPAPRLSRSDGHQRKVAQLQIHTSRRT